MTGVYNQRKYQRVAYNMNELNVGAHPQMRSPSQCRWHNDVIKNLETQR
jgi:hypothetical protein